MLRVVQFELHNHYGLQNAWTNNVLTKKNGDPLIFRTQWGARRKARKLTKNLETTLSSISKKEYHGHQ